MGGFFLFFYFLNNSDWPRVHIFLFVYLGGVVVVEREREERHHWPDNSSPDNSSPDNSSSHGVHHHHHHHQAQGKKGFLLHTSALSVYCLADGGGGVLGRLQLPSHERTTTTAKVDTGGHQQLPSQVPSAHRWRQEDSAGRKKVLWTAPAILLQLIFLISIFLFSIF